MPLGSSGSYGGGGGATGYTAGTYSAPGINLMYTDPTATTGKSIYALVYNESREYWNPSTETMTAFTGDYADHAVVMPQAGDVLLNAYYANIHPSGFPMLSTGNYYVQIFEGSSYTKGGDEPKTEIVETYYNQALDGEVTTAQVVDILTGILQTFDDPSTGENASLGEAPKKIDELLELMRVIARRPRDR